MCYKKRFVIFTSIIMARHNKLIFGGNCYGTVGNPVDLQLGCDHVGGLLFGRHRVRVQYHAKSGIQVFWKGQKVTCFSRPIRPLRGLYIFRKKKNPGKQKKKTRL